MKPSMIHIALVLIALGCQAKKTTRGAAPQPDPTTSQPGQPTQPTQPTVPTQPTLPTQPTPTCIDAASDICDAEQELFRLTNNLRQENGLPPLTLDPKLSFAARDWSKQQADSGRIGHAGFQNGERHYVMQQRFPNEALPKMSRENVAMSYVGRNRGIGFVNTFLNMWANSSGHRVNMLSRTSKIGVGIHIRSNGSAYATQIFGN